jgi:hypothetical protein
MSNPLQRELPNNQYNEECPISSETFEELAQRKDLIETHCGHKFSQIKLIEWFEKDKTCPMCRKELDKKAFVQLVLTDAVAKTALSSSSSSSNDHIAGSSRIPLSHRPPCYNVEAFSAPQNPVISDHEKAGSERANCGPVAHLHEILVMGRAATIERARAVQKRGLRTTPQEIGPAIPFTEERRDESCGPAVHAHEILQMGRAATLERLRSLSLPHKLDPRPLTFMPGYFASPAHNVRGFLCMTAKCPCKIQNLSIHVKDADSLKELEEPNKIISLPSFSDNLKTVTVPLYKERRKWNCSVTVHGEAYARKAIHLSGQELYYFHQQGKVWW